MTDYIDRAIAAKGLHAAHDYYGEAYICAIPAADVAEVRHGRWECLPLHDVDNCSICGYMPDGHYVFNYCPNCGAKMDESEGEDN